MATGDRDVLFRAQRLVDGGSPMADTLLENAGLRTRIAALESQLDRYRWRRVEDEIPEAWGSVLIPYAKSVVEAFVDQEGEWWLVRVKDQKVLGVRHWMPLPPAPEEGE